MTIDVHRGPRKGTAAVLAVLVAVTALVATTPAQADNPPVFVATWGTTGTGDGQFDTPVGVAIDPVTGDVHVVEHLNERVQRFTAAGGHLATWGTAGTGDGQFDQPFGAAVDPTSGDGRTLRIVADEVPGPRLTRVRTTPGAIPGDPDDLVHVDWSDLREP